MYETKYHDKDLSQLKFLVTGGAGFIGSNIVEYLLKYGAGKVRVLDNLSTGFQANVDLFINNAAYEFMQGDIRDVETCKQAVEGMDYVLHQAALGSVPRSIHDPLTTHAVNCTGFLNMLWAVKENGNVMRFVYAASSSTYGDSKELPKVEDRIGKPLSPYAITKFNNEQYADVFGKTYGIQHIGLRYFNVFGPRQSPEGAYAAVIPLFIAAINNNQSPKINGGGIQTRDFTFVENVVHANIKALFAEDSAALNQVYNVACGERTSLNELWKMINDIAGKDIPAIYVPSRNGDIQDSLADVGKIKKMLGYTIQVKITEGIKILFQKKVAYQVSN
jgi:UDP-N-acetylglucosamine 4-epimerase